MIHRAKTITTDLVEEEPPPPPTKGKKGQERLMKRPSDAMKVGADAARHTTRSKSLPEAKVTKPTGDLDLGDLDLFTKVCPLVWILYQTTFRGRRGEPRP